MPVLAIFGRFTLVDVCALQYLLAYCIQIFLPDQWRVADTPSATNHSSIIHRRSIVPCIINELLDCLSCPETHWFVAKDNKVCCFSNGNFGTGWLRGSHSNGKFGSARYTLLQQLSVSDSAGIWIKPTNKISASFSVLA